MLSSSALFLLATAVIPAVQNSMFTTRSARLSQSISVNGQWQLAPVVDQMERMTGNFLNEAYSVCWLGQAMPAFATRDYAVAPFAHIYAGSDDDPGVTVTSQTTRYWTEMDCWSPSSIEMDFTNNLTTMSDGRGCIAQNVTGFSPYGLETDIGSYEGLYFGAQALPRNALARTCPQFPHLVLLTWGKMLKGDETPDYSQDGNSVAMFCEPAYYSQSVEATIAASNGSMISYRPTGSAQRLTDDLFNRTNFESIITNGIPSTFDTAGNSSQLRVDIADATVLQQETRLINLGVSTHRNSLANAMVGFAVGASQRAASEYFDFQVLQEAYSKAHKLLFALAMLHTFETPGPILQDATLASVSESVQLVSTFTIITEVLLALVVLICTSLLLLAPRRRLRLNKDPDSLANIMMLSRSTEIQRAFSNMSLATEDQLSRSLKNISFRLGDDAQGYPLLQQATGLPSKARETDIDGGNKDYHRQKAKHLPEMSWSSSIAVLVLVGCSVAVFITTKILTHPGQGITLPSDSELVQQLLLNFVPTAFATLLGVYLTLICRNYSFLQPMEDLYRGDAPARRTLLVTYTSLPAPLLFTKAWGVGHYLLGLLSIAALLSNVLTVTIASLFLTQDTTIAKDAQLTALYQPNVVDTGKTRYVGGANNMDCVYAAVANLSDLTKLPPWTTSDYGYLPIDLSTIAMGPVSSEYELESTGYGADLNCVNLLDSRPGLSASLEFWQRGQQFRLWANYTLSDGNITSCHFTNQHENGTAIGAIIGEISSSPSSLEISTRMSETNTRSSFDFHFCSNKTVRGWVRGVLDDAPGTNIADESRSEYNSTLISCDARLKTQRSLLRVTSDGSILSATPLSPPDYDLPPTVNFSSTFGIALSATMATNSQPNWHNDTIARDWSNYLYKKVLNSTELVDSSTPVPSFDKASRLVSDMFSRLFAIQLSIDASMLLPLTTSAKSVSNWDTSAFPEEAPGPYTIPAKTYFSERRIFISWPNFMISIAILTFDFIVLLVFRLRLRKPFLPRMPFTIASQIAFFSGSHVIDDVVKAGGNLKELDKRGYRYGYGRYIGKDGWAHVGIEREPFVTRLYDEGPDRKGRAKQGWWKRMWMWPWSREGKQPASVEMNSFEFQALPRQDGKKSDASVTVEEKDNNWI